MDHMTLDEADEDDSLPLRELLRLAGGVCTDCQMNYSARDAVFSVALGFKNAPRCLRCTANRLGRVEPEVRQQLVEYVRRRECYLRAWRAAEGMDGVTEPASRECEGEGDATTPLPGGPGSPEASATWDAGDMGCGELVMALRLRMNTLPAGGVIRVTATDPAAPEDIPAWCRLTGHPLLSADHPHYVIRQRGA
jgi:tRNA 2-thiouridine synthesizing protein A